MAKPPKLFFLLLFNCESLMFYFWSIKDYATIYVKCLSKAADLNKAQIVWTESYWLRGRLTHVIPNCRGWGPLQMCMVCIASDHFLNPWCPCTTVSTNAPNILPWYSANSAAYLFSPSQAVTALLVRQCWTAQAMEPLTLAWHGQHVHPSKLLLGWWCILASEIRPKPNMNREVSKNGLAKWEDVN